MAAGSDKGTSGAVVTALLANFGIAVAKFTVAFLSGSAAMMAEAWHSVADTGNQAFLLLGIHSSKRPPDQKHPFGYGKDQFFWAFVVAISLFTLGGLFSFQHGIEKIHHASDPSNHGGPFTSTQLLYNAIVIVVAIGFETLAFRKAYKRLKELQEGGFWSFLQRTKHMALVTVFFEDLAALTGLFVAGGGLLLSYLTHNVIWDGIASIIIGVLLGCVAVFLAFETRGLLLGERASLEIVHYIESLLNETEEIVDRNQLRTMQVGPNTVMAGVLVKMSDQLTVEEMDAITDQLQQRVEEKFPEVKHLYIEVEDDHEQPKSQETNSENA